VTGFEQVNETSLWPHRLAVATVGATLGLIFVGGLVTNTGSALAVPDWPTTFGYNMFLYPWSKMVGGIFYEHSHRLLGSAVGLLTMLLAIWLWLREARRWVRLLGVVAVAAVIVQGILGGMRVVLQDHDLALVHGCVAQAFLALMVTLAVVTSAPWHTAPQCEPLRAPTPLAILARVTVPLVYVQLVFGALLTHTGGELAWHVTFAALLTCAVVLLARRALFEAAAHPELRRPAILLVVLLAIQLSLGLGAYAWRFMTLSVSVPAEVGLAVLALHRLTGAALWATVVGLALRVLRLVRPAAAATHVAVAAGRGHRVVA
jgi:cytochrome c oxidase assembly protein subunit 15